MTKKYLFKIILLCVLLSQVFTRAQAQYAIGGTAGTTLVNSVYWLTWDKTASNSTLISQPATADAFHIVNGTYVWQFSPTVRITAVISNQQFVGGNSMQAYTSGSYSGDGLNLIYSGNNLPLPDSRGVANSGLATTNGETVTFDIDVKVAILINNVYTDVVYPGMVVADAESIDAGGEFISGDTPNAIAWQLLNKRTQNNSADSHYKMDLSNGGKSFKLYADLTPGNFGVQAVMFAHNARNIQNVSMKGSGITALAIGFVLPFDLGDAPATYGTTGHYMENFQITDYYAGDGTYSVVNYATTPLVPVATVYMGANNVDPDGQPVGTTAATNDDITGNNDENTLTPSTLPDVKVNQAGNIVFTVPVTNTKSVPAVLRGWIDFNNDGIFSPDEEVEVPVPANTNNQSFTLTFLNSSFAGKVKVGPLYARLRVTTTTLLDDVTTVQDERSVSFAADGEAEDYKLKDILGVNISGTIYNDGNGGADNVISGTGIQAVSGTQLYAYLVDNTGTIVNKTTVGAGGVYTLANNNNGTYTVAISTNNVAVGGTLASVAANLPSNWKASGASYGNNNSGNAGIQPGTPNLQIQAVTPGTSLDVSGVNFGINQIPVANNDAGSTNVGVPVTLNVPANDTDADGTIDPTKVLLIDPADNAKKTSVTISGQGTYTVNTSTGQVTFTPLATFTGKTVPLAYTIKDNFGSESVSALITIDVKPAGVSDTDLTPIGTPVTTNVKANDGASATGTTVTATNGLHGTTAVDATGKVTYTPNSTYVGTDTYTYTLTTADGVVSSPITVTINIKPVGVNDATTTPINTPVTTTVTANDGASGVGSTVTPTNGLHGNTTVDATGNVTYTPTAGYVGKDTYTYTLTNGGVSDPITVTVSIKPVGVNDVDVTPVNTPVTTTVKANDGPSGIGTTVTATAGSHGVTSVDPATGKVTYTPVAGYVGTDTYTYTLTTADGVVSDPITVTITIKPVGVNDATTTPINTPVTTTVTANDGPSATGAIVTPTNGAHGTTTADASGKVTYTPVANFTGTDTYTYTLTNFGQTSDPITVTVTVKPVGTNDADVTQINTPVTTTVKSNDGASATGTTVTPTNGAHGTTTVDATGKVTYTPATGYAGTDSYTYTLTTPDGVVSDPITVNITVYSASLSLTKTSTSVVGKVGDVINYTLVVTNTGTSVLTNMAVADAGADAGSITPASIASLAAGASATVTAKHTVTAADVTAGSYSNQASVSGTDPFGKTVTKSKSDDPTTAAVDDPTTVIISQPGSVSIVKTGVFNSYYITYTFVVKNTGPSTLNSLKFSDTNLGLTNTAVAVPAGGLLPGASVTFTYNYTLTQADKDLGSVSNTATVTGLDPAGRTVTANSSIVIAVPKSPVASDDVVQVGLNRATVISPLKNDNSGNSSFNLASIVIVNPPSHGTVSIGGDGTITYTPNSGYSGPDSFTYQVKDLNGYSTNVAKVTINVSAVTPLKIPTLFTPNGDGRNDTFVIIGLDQVIQNKLSIVNRWGNEVFHATGYQNNWDGNGLNEGTYYYVLQVQDSVGGDWIVYKGYVTLIRTFKK